MSKLLPTKFLLLLLPGINSFIARERSEESDKKMVRQKKNEAVHLLAVSQRLWKNVIVQSFEYELTNLRNQKNIYIYASILVMWAETLPVIDYTLPS